MINNKELPKEVVEEILKSIHLYHYSFEIDDLPKEAYSVLAEKVFKITQSHYEPIIEELRKENEALKAIIDDKKDAEESYLDYINKKRTQNKSDL